jgi:hypothetical protein
MTLWISGLLDPTHTKKNASKSVVVSDKDLWNGALYCSFCESSALGWEEVRQDGFFCVASGSWSRNTSKLLETGPRAWINHEKV